MRIEQVSRNVHNVRCTYSAERKEFWFLLSADHHIDNPDCRRDLVEKHLKQAQERDALVFMFGDLFCAMQGKFDKRSDKTKIRPEHATGNYLDSLVSTTADFLRPYRTNIGLISLGNHETAILQRHETNLTERLVERLNIGNLDTVYSGGYGGYVRFMFESASKGGRSSKVLKYFHGYGGGGPVTKGVIQSQRQALIYPDADIMVSGHVHERYTMEYVQERIKDSGKVELRSQLHVRTPTYKDEYKDGFGGWHIETGKPPKPLGAWWLKMEVDTHTGNVYYDVLKAE